MPRVVVSIVNFNSADLTARCISALGSPLIDKILVWDNSPDDIELADLRNLAAADARVEVRQNGQNLGFGAGHNANLKNIKSSSDTFFWLLNPDAEPQEGAVEALLSHCVESAGKTIFSPMLVFAGPSDLGRETWFETGVFDAQRVRVHHVNFGRPWSGPGSYASDLLETEFLPGTALFLASDTWLHLNGFDENFFLYWEDVDLSLRARELGYLLRTDTTCHLVHEEGGSQRGRGKSKRHSRVYYYWNNFGRQLMIARHGRRDISSRITQGIYAVAYISRPLREQCDYRGFLSSLQGAQAGRKLARRSEELSK